MHHFNRHALHVNFLLAHSKRTQNCSGTLVCFSGWLPVLWADDGQTDLTLLVNVRMVDSCLECNLSSLHGMHIQTHIYIDYVKASTHEVFIQSLVVPWEAWMGILLESWFRFWMLLYYMAHCPETKRERKEKWPWCSQEVKVVVNSLVLSDPSTGEC